MIRFRAWAGIGIVLGWAIVCAAQTLPPLESRIESLRKAVTDLNQSYDARYPKGAEYLSRVEGVAAQVEKAKAGGGAQVRKLTEAFEALQREALLANPLLDFDKLLVIQRKPVGDPRRPRGEDKGLGEFLGLPRQSSWQLDTMPDIDDWDNEIAMLSQIRTEGCLSTVYRPDKPGLVTDVDLHFDAGRILFAMPGDNRCFQVFEMTLDGGQPRQVTPKGQPDVHNFDGFYLPDGRIGFLSTCIFQGVPCNAAVNVASLFRMDADGTNIRRLTFDQDHNYSPSMTNDGRILYLRWEYTDIPHVWARYLFTMSPDGMGQREFYGSGSFWPNSIFYTRAIPNHPTQVVGIVTGHHVGRVGELVVFDPARGRTTTEGVVKRIGMAEEVKPIIQDKLTDESWPKFLHPWPLSDKYFLVSAKPTPEDLWGIYLVDIFDNVTLIKELEGWALMEPIPLAQRPAPPVIADRVDLNRKDALAYVEDIYRGPGLAGVPRGAVKQLRLYTYHFGYQNIAGIVHRVGADGPWEPKRVMGTVPVESDGSAFFRVPANTPISIQPLDKDGKSLQLMRSWMTAMPGEVVSCVGCHEKQNSTAPAMRTIAARREVSEIQPWRGPERGFSFAREVQPVLDKYCVGCHDGTPAHHGLNKPDLQRRPGVFAVLKNQDPKVLISEGIAREELFKNYGGVFEPSYIELRKFVRVGGFESDIRVLDPMEFGAETTELIQMLQKGHHGVTLDAEAWDRLFVWIDLNGTCHGTWAEVCGATKTMRDHDRRMEYLKLYANREGDPEQIFETAAKEITPIVPSQEEIKLQSVKVAGWPFDADEAKRKQAAAGGVLQRTIDLGDGEKLELVRVPAGEFVMGDPAGEVDERPCAVRIERAFWMGRCEVTNEQYAKFDATHDSRYEDKGSWAFSEGHLGWPLNGPRQPVIRVSQAEASAFCRWLSERTGQRVTLPTEAQWEWACRAGTESEFWYGGLDTDFSKAANLADVSIRRLGYETDGNYTADLAPRDTRVNDKALVTVEVGRFAANPWGLFDMHGNAWEWTRTGYRPYPYRDDDGRNTIGEGDRAVVRGGSWYDRPKRARSAFRLSYPAWQRVHDVGFRVVIEEK